MSDVILSAKGLKSGGTIGPGNAIIIWVLGVHPHHHDLGYAL